MASKDKQQAKAANRRRQAVDMVRGESVPSDLESLSLEQMRRMYHELQVHQIELEMLNEELQRTQAELDDARVLYFDFYNLASVGYCTVNSQGEILDANLTLARMLGQDREALLKEPLGHFVLADDLDLYELHREQLVSTGTAQARDLRMRRSDGAPFWAQLQATAALNADGVPVSHLVISDITDRKEAEEQLRHSLLEKDVMLKEIHHRVKNNLQVVCSLLNLQAKRITDPETRVMFEESRDRVMSMALVHERLYQSKHLANIDFKEYLHRFAAGIAATYNQPQITIDVGMDNIALTVNVGIPCGLIVHELLSNALKYAFPHGRPGRVALGISLNEQGHKVLVVEDDGIGFPAEVDFRNTPSLGMQIVMGLVGQIHGTIELSRAAGTRFCITFP
jgi:PAS domain S-box-containing protein